MVILLLFTSFLSQTIFAGEPPKIVQDHLFRVLRLSDWQLNSVQKQMRSLIKLADKNHKLTPDMLNYFAIYPERLLALRSAAKKAELQSKTICGVLEEPRHVNDEVDALRHFILSALLTKKIGKEPTLEILSLQEDRGEIKTYDTYMDLLNNKIGVEYIEKSKKRVSLYDILREGEKILYTGGLNVYQSKPSACQQKLLYPNLPRD